MYARWSERRWTHFLPADFALAAFSGEGGVATDGVKEMFLSYNITYNVGECRLVMAPILLHCHWCLYVWDFERKVMVVLDPIQ
ncbi:hypothetical protein GQ55_8G052700 [Panicum hallii var. hallii]|uniref:Ubiquitin-like protease family profile domain-containing protein n=1 Tax=Panicum hallii var. hallii TaxID=1504633 RepID=A0A2T7CKX6_9POAL|nr:hypothetical protein GQ55_8G052700 [Panicum hallii var. hallii]